MEIQPAEAMESRKPLFVNGDQCVENRVVSIPSQNALLLKCVTQNKHHALVKDLTKY